MKISINNLSTFDQNYLKQNGKFSTTDQNGNDRNAGQDKIGRQTLEGQDENFERVLSAVTHEIIRRCMDRKLSAIAIYQINDFVLNLKTGFANTRVKRIIRKVMKDFIGGEEFVLSLSDKEIEYNLEQTSRVTLDFRANP